MPEESKTEKPLEVELPVCRLCGQISKVPTTTALSQIKSFCMGPMSAPHKRTKMEPARFVEAE